MKHARVTFVTLCLHGLGCQSDPPDVVAKAEGPDAREPAPPDEVAVDIGGAADLALPGLAKATKAFPLAPPRLTLAAGSDHTCAVVRVAEGPRGRVKCWGENDFGQLGLGDTKVRGASAAQMGDALPFVGLPEDADIIAVDAAINRSCALSSDGRLWCWGANERGQLGLGDTRARGADRDDMATLAPVDLPGAVASFSLGDQHACAVSRSGSVWCWGAGADGQTGHADAEFRGDEPAELGEALQPVDLGTGVHAFAVAAGAAHTCVLVDGGAVKCFGLGRYGVLGLPDTRSRGAGPAQMDDALPPVSLGEFRAVQVVSGGLHACARSVDHRVVCWGGNKVGQLGVENSDSSGGKPGESRRAAPGGDARPKVDLGDIREVVALAAGGTTTCATVLPEPPGASETVTKCWGGRYGGGSPGEMGRALPTVDAGPGRTLIAVASGGLHHCAIVVDRTVATEDDVRPTAGQVVCWGAWVPGVGFSHALGVPANKRTESLADNPAVVRLGKDVHVALPAMTNVTSLESE